MNSVRAIKSDLEKMANPEKAAYMPEYFQAYPGGYGEGDLFMGVTVPNQRKVARKYFRSISLPELAALLGSEVHEHRLTALFILTYRYEKEKAEDECQKLVDFYLDNLAAVNNWDLVDSTAYKILGHYLYTFKIDRSLLYDLAGSGDLWKQRIAIIATLYFIKNNDFEDTLKLSDFLLNHEHDLIHKAVGWMLREVGNRDFEKELNFLKSRYRQMPRTMLRYAIEKFDPELRKSFLSGHV